jgi:hypothetical protein
MSKTATFPILALHFAAAATFIVAGIIAGGHL